ncbi:serine--tRNA ligase [candidate division KSB1 bacterium]|nr:serine--tRNA ligase [candidate division KSB1 bacterium]
MLDYRFIKENRDAIEENCHNRLVKIDLDAVLALIDRRLDLINQVDDIRRQQNDIAQKIKSCRTHEERQPLIQEGARLKQEEKERRGELDQVLSELKTKAEQIPNMTHPEAPVGSTEDENVEIKRFGEPTSFSFKPKDHVQLAHELDLIDFDGATKVAARAFYYLKNELVMLELGLTRYALDVVLAEGFTPFITPDLARADILAGTGYNPRGEETQVYSVADSDLCLIGTAEITLGGLYSGTMLDEAQLPLKLAGISHCFRTEAGAHGRVAKGLYRVHQFSKVEMFAFTTPEASDDMHDEIRRIEEKIFSNLDLPFRVVDICTGDLGGPAYRKFDLEAWMPGREVENKWGEITSTSNCTDYQARRLEIKYRSRDGKKKEYVHMLNGTAIAMPRAIIALLENNQQADGSIRIPEKLVPYVGFEVIKKKGSSPNAGEGYDI